ncbi:MAG TPA: Uma2 family endonuclease [Planctomycetota bacterium]|nr:Uma2 family endonuclease [Planctomycetota bacterium]
MKAVLLEVPESLLEERRRKGLDRFDEMWDGVLHMVPPPSGPHQDFTGELRKVIEPLAEAKGLKTWIQAGLFRPGSAQLDYREPDLMCFDERYATERGVDGPAEFVVETLSPGDESYEKLPFYETLRCREVLLVHPQTCVFDFYALRGKKLAKVKRDSHGAVRSKVLGATFATVKGPKLRIAWKGGEAFVKPFVPRA